MLWSSSCLAGGPVFHAFFAQFWLNEFEEYNFEQSQQFFLGNLYPDIRYIENIGREETHESKVTFKKVVMEKDPFRKGVLLHSYLDKMRSQKVNKLKTARLISKQVKSFTGHFLKLVEDEILFEKINQTQAKVYLSGKMKPTAPLPVSTVATTKWRYLLKLYFTASPKILIKQLEVLSKLFENLSKKMIFNWDHLLERYSKDKKMIKKTNKLIDELKKQLIKNKKAHKV